MGINRSATSKMNRSWIKFCLRALWILDELARLFRNQQAKSGQRNQAPIIQAQIYCTKDGLGLAYDLYYERICPVPCV